ncbi:hypothetical protein QYE76_042746 [Lolium multiflorum]|uniref:Transposase-associated domain-containing protein n=1 Tax=Lolium multiflorum TaxID=4521 RepID=A0AAD8THD6_LOLMU|nr:hypothetical protein QYE76_042746 [Lolium multiflorum]
MAVSAARVLQHGDGSFMSPFGFGQARWAWFAPVDAPGRCPHVGVEVVPSSVAADLLHLVLGWHLLLRLASFRLPCTGSPCGVLQSGPAAGGCPRLTTPFSKQGAREIFILLRHRGALSAVMGREREFGAVVLISIIPVLTAVDRQRRPLRYHTSMSRQWMYGDRCHPEFITGMHYFLNVAEANRRSNGFMYCPCSSCKNMKDYPTSKTLHIHLLENGFMPSYNCWTKHGERGVILEDNEEEEDSDNYPLFTEDGGSRMGEDEAEEEPIFDEPIFDDPDDDLGRAILDAKMNCGNEKERLKLEKMLEDHNKLLYPNCENGQKKLGTTLELLQWKAENGTSDKGFEKLLKIIKKMLTKQRTGTILVLLFNAQKLATKRNKLSIDDRFIAIGEELAGFFLRDVIPPFAEFHYE